MVSKPAIGLCALAAVAVWGVSESVASVRAGGWEAREDAFPFRQLRFEPNRGQAADGVAFLARGDRHRIFLTDRGLAVTFDDPAIIGGAPGRLTLRFLDPEDGVAPEGRRPLRGQVHYFRGPDPEGWIGGVPQYAEVLYRGVYPGVDAVFYSRDGRLEYDFVVHPGADPGRIRLALETSGNVALTAGGDLLVTAAGGELTFLRPVVYQVRDGRRIDVEGRYELAEVPGGWRVGFSLGDHDPRIALVIDPVLVYASYLGGSLEDFGHRVAVDGEGNAYFVGDVRSFDFPRVEPHLGDAFPSADAYVVKVDPTGSELIYTAFYGGPGFQLATGVAVDGEGRAYLAGSTDTGAVPLVNPIDDSFGGGRDAFVVRLDPAGAAITFATFLGGDGHEGSAGLTLDEAGRIYVAGATSSSDFPQVPGTDPPGGQGDAFSDAFFAGIDPDTPAILFSVVFGSPGNDWGEGVALAPDGTVVLAGFTEQDVLLGQSALHPFAGVTDVFLVKMDPSTADVLASTYLGGGRQDELVGVGVDAGGRVLVGGQTSSIDFPVADPVQAEGGDNFDLFLTQLSPDLDQVLFSTYLGGRCCSDYVEDVAFDGEGSAYFVGWVDSSSDFPSTPSAFQPEIAGSRDAFLVKIRTADRRLEYATFFGGTGEDRGDGVAVDDSGNVYLTGTTYSTDLPVTPGVFQSLFGGGFRNAWVARVAGTPSDRLAVEAVAPPQGGDTGQVSLVVLGGGFAPEASVRLERGASTADAAAVSVDETGFHLTASFDLAGRARGSWDVVVENPDGVSATLAEGFEVVAGAAPEVWVDLLGRSNARGGRSQTYNVVFGNRGNVDARAPLLVVSSPSPGTSFAFLDRQEFRPGPLYVLGAARSGLAGFLGPGAANQVDLLVQLPAILPGNQATLEVGLADVAGRAFEWDALTSGGVPEGTDPDLWQDAVGRARGAIGESWDEVLDFLAGAASAPQQSPGELVHFEELLAVAVGSFLLEPPAPPAAGIAAKAGTAGSSVEPRAAIVASPSCMENRCCLGVLEPVCVKAFGVINKDAEKHFVITHGLNDGPGEGPFETTRFEELAQRISVQEPDANVFIVDWSVPAFGDPFTVASRINPAAAKVRRLLEEFERRGDFDHRKGTFIGESFGNYVNGAACDALDGRCDRALVLNPASFLTGYAPATYREHFNESRSLHTDSFFDTPQPFTDCSLRFFPQDGLNDHQKHTAALGFLTERVEACHLGQPCPLLDFSRPCDEAPFGGCWHDGSVDEEGNFSGSPLPCGFKKARPGDVGSLDRASLSVRLVGSIDPNEKLGSRGGGAAGFLAEEEPLRYTILFENLETATAPAQEVVITDELDTATLDLDTFVLGPFAFSGRRVDVPPQASSFAGEVDLRPAQDLLVRIEAGVDRETGVATWRFTALDPETGDLPEDPLAGFLPPNVVPPEGDGSVQFTIRPLPGLAGGTEIRNRASIVFDTNAAIVTPEWLNTLDVSLPESRVEDLGERQCETPFEVRATGSDADSGVAGYELFASRDGGPFEKVFEGGGSPWTFAGQAGGTYAFYSLARDLAGHREGPPATPDATTFVDGSGDADGDGVCASLDCDDADPVLSAADGCGVCGGDASTCGVFSDGFESGDLRAWSR